MPEGAVTHGPIATGRNEATGGADAAPGRARPDWAAAAQQAADRMLRGWSVAFACGTAMSDGMQSILRENLDCARQIAAKIADGWQEAARSRSPSALLGVQGDLFWSGIDATLRSAARVTALSAETVDALADRLTAAGRESAR